MNREADHTIKGFVYQFNKTLEEILLSENGTKIKVEGIVEDIDIISTDKIKAVQCKYHETKNKFSLSDIAKPILQMLTHYSENTNKNIQYVLYAHFPNETKGEKQLTIKDIEKILETKNKKYIANYISKIKPPKDKTIKDLIQKERKNSSDLTEIAKYYKRQTDLDTNIILTNFLEPERFKFIIGKSYGELIKDTQKLLEEKTSFSNEDITEIFYPNAIQIIADKSIESNGQERIIERKNFLNKLENTKKVAISRWTKELLSFKKIMKRRREQLLPKLKENHRLRYFIINVDSLYDFDKQIINFIVDYLKKYHYKIKLHSKTPVFCFQTKNDEIISEIESRLYEKNIYVNTGYIGKKFYEKEFLKEPQRIIKDSWFEFRLRLCILSNEIIDLLKNNKCDDLFLIGNIRNKEINNMLDVNIEKIGVSNFNELKYLLNLKKDIE